MQTPRELIVYARPEPRPFDHYCRVPEAI